MPAVFLWLAAPLAFIGLVAGATLLWDTPNHRRYRKALVAIRIGMDPAPLPGRSISPPSVFAWRGDW